MSYKQLWSKIRLWRISTGSSASLSCSSHRASLQDMWWKLFDGSKSEQTCESDLFLLSQSTYWLHDVAMLIIYSEKWHILNCQCNVQVRTVHEKQKPYKCSQCPSTFAFKDGLESHILTVHDQHRPLTCPSCTMRFKTNAHLNKHCVKVHPSEPSGQWIFSIGQKILRIFIFMTMWYVPFLLLLSFPG